MVTAEATLGTRLRSGVLARDSTAQPVVKWERADNAMLRKTVPLPPV